MLSVEILKDLGDIRGAMYSFEKAGDILPKHMHNEFDNHITIVALGKIKVYSHDWEKEIVSGQLVNFRSGEPHEIMALEDNTRIFNIVKKYGGAPNEYRTVDVPPEIQVETIELK
jgi:quercetin dioxygenase-like cupin family protein